MNVKKFFILIVSNVSLALASGPCVAAEKKLPKKSRRKEKAERRKEKAERNYWERYGTDKQGPWDRHGNWLPHRTTQEKALKKIEKETGEIWKEQRNAMLMAGNNWHNDKKLQRRYLLGWGSGAEKKVGAEPRIPGGILRKPGDPRRLEQGMIKTKWEEWAKEIPFQYADEVSQIKKWREGVRKIETPSIFEQKGENNKSKAQRREYRIYGHGFNDPPLPTELAPPLPPGPVPDD